MAPRRRRSLSASRRSSTIVEFHEGRICSGSTAPSASSISRVLSRTFLPENFPESVTADYLGEGRRDAGGACTRDRHAPRMLAPCVPSPLLAAAFQSWDTVQAISSYVRGMLSSKAIMTGIGVGQAAATAYGAVFLFAVRDLTGMLGGLVFAHLEVRCALPLALPCTCTPSARTLAACCLLQASSMWAQARRRRSKEHRALTH